MYLGDTYFFKDNHYWVLKRGGLDQDDVTPKSIAVDWLRCPAPAPTANVPVNPKIPQGCSCAFNASPALPRSPWAALVCVVLVIHELVRK